MSSPSIYALPGFIGESSDWDFLNLDIVKFSIYHLPSIKMGKWAAEFNNSIKQQEGKKILMGYSLGGRLAMHTLIENPFLWQAGIFISSNVGFSCPKMKQRRLESDKKWASLFETQEWISLMEAWNNQLIFKDSANPVRMEKNYARSQLASTLRVWSLGHQDNLEPYLEKLQIPILWIVGELDRSYVAKAQTLQLSHPQSTVWIAPQAGHRILWDKPQQLKDQINIFIKGLI